MEGKEVALNPFGNGQGSDGISSVRHPLPVGNWLEYTEGPNSDFRSAIMGCSLPYGYRLNPLSIRDEIF